MPALGGLVRCIASASTARSAQLPTDGKLQTVQSVASLDELGRPRALTGRSVLFVCALAGLCGAFLGTTNSLQTALESAQVLAGKITYPADNPFYLYHIKSWSLTHQIPALLLQLGMTEQVLSLLLGAFIGMISFQAIALSAFVVSRNCWFAIALPILLGASGIYEEIDYLYPVRLLSGHPWLCYGVIGTSWVVLCWSLFASPCVRVAALLTGLAPAVHPTLGAWCLGVSVAAMYLSHRRHPQPWRTLALWLAIGIAFTTISFCLHQYHARNVPPISPELRDRYVQAFAEGWDSHRQAAPLISVTSMYGFFALAISLVWLVRLRHALDVHSSWMLAAMLVSSLGGLLLLVSTQFPERLPTVILMAMPARYINTVSLLLPPVLLGLLLRRKDFLPLAVLSGACAYLLLRGHYIEWEMFYIPKTYYLVGFLGLMLLASAWSWRKPATNRQPHDLFALRWLAVLGMVAVAGLVGPHQIKVGLMFACGAVCEAVAGWYPTRRASRWLALAALGCLGLVLFGTSAVVLGFGMTVSVGALGVAAAILFWPTGKNKPAFSHGARLALSSGTFGVGLFAIGVFGHARAYSSYYHLYDYERDPLLRRIHQGEGMILTGSNVRLIQLRTQRPVLLEAVALNQLPYVPESAPSMNYILRQVYGEDILAPRPDWWIRERGGPICWTVQGLWENRTAEEWQALADEFGFTEIVTHKSWNLKLPVIAQEKKLKLYRVPGATAEAYHRLVRQKSSTVALTSQSDHR